MVDDRSPLSRWKFPLMLGACACAYLWVAIRGPQGFYTLIEKHREIRQLEEQNAAAAQDNQRRRERIRKLAESQSEQEIEIRKQLKLLRPGETTFILPESEHPEGEKPSPAQ